MFHALFVWVGRLSNSIIYSKLKDEMYAIDLVGSMLPERKERVEVYNKLYRNEGCEDAKYVLIIQSRRRNWYFWKVSKIVPPTVRSDWQDLW